MSPTKEIISQALHLKPAEKYVIVETLLKSLDAPDIRMEKIWADESEKRYEALIKGKVRTFSLGEVKKKLRR